MESLRTQFPANDFAILAVVLLLPALGAFVNGIFGKRLGKEGVRLMALAAIGGAFLASVLTFLLLPHGSEEGPGRLTWTAWHWFSISGRMQQRIPIDVAFSVDAMTATMMLVVTGVGFLIHLYATEYMKKDDGFHRFFAYLNLFCFSMLVLIMADNLALLFVGWEGVGMCSYLLIGFWFTEDKNASAGRKAFIVNRIGDFGLLVAMSMIVYYLGTLKFTEINIAAGRLVGGDALVKIWPIGNLTAQALPGFLASILIPKQPVEVYAATLVGLALFLGCAGKSAQIPLYIWLPDAMAGPTPVSALIHAATMVTAGVYLVARMSAVFLLSPAAMATVAIVGTLTALFAASIGLFQHDLKKVLAYSTVSQLGFMFIGVGVGAFSAGFFHVFTHAFFKACLFLGAGSVIHAMHARIHDTDKSQDMRNMGGLAQYLPITRWTFLLSCFAIAGAPPLAGFWSKDEILWRAFSSVVKTPAGASSRVPMWAWPGWLGPAIYWAGILAATMTAFYMFRAYFTTFHGKFRGWTIKAGWKDPHAHGHHDDHHHEDEGPIEGPAPHESALPMTVPLMVLAAFAVFAGFLNAEPIHSAPLGHALEPLFKAAEGTVLEREGTKGLEWTMMVPGVLAFLGGAGAAMVVYLNRGGEPERAFAKSVPGLYRLIYDKWRIDELYDATVVGMVDALADIFTMSDKWIVDGILAKLSAAIVGAAGTVLRALQTGKVQAYSAGMVIGLGSIGWFMMRPHAVATVEDHDLRKNGEVVITAAPGLGYTYRWEGADEQNKDGAFSDKREVTVKLAMGDKKEVTLVVKNAFDAVDRQTFTLNRPRPKGQPNEPDAAPDTNTIPTVIPAEKIPDLIRGHQ
ncbi:MAG: NADH-quinone oxidoreductase subunit L [Byssovorax sp.]